MLLDHTTLQHIWPRANAAEFFIAIEADHGPLLPTWPRDLQQDFSSAIGRWRDANPLRNIVALTTACAPDAGAPGKFTATVVLHHVPHASEATTVPPASPATQGEDHGKADQA